VNSSTRTILNVWSKGCVENYCERKYSPTAKHDKVTGWDSIIDLTDEVAYDVLNSGVEVEGKKQIFGQYAGHLYIFQPDNAGSYHGYKADAVEVPNEALRKMVAAGLLDEHTYQRLNRLKTGERN
jgi:hypothetical protein